MNNPFTASEVREKAKTFGAGDIYCMLHAFADMLEARERAEPVAWMYPELHKGHPYPEECLSPEAFDGWLPLYTHPAPSDAERLAEALQEILDYRGGAANALEDEYVVDRAHQALAVHSAQAQKGVK